MDFPPVPLPAVKSPPLKNIGKVDKSWLNAFNFVLLWKRWLVQWMKTKLSNYLTFSWIDWVLETKPLEGGQQSATDFIFKNDDGGGRSKGNRLSHQMCLVKNLLFCHCQELSPGTWSWGWPCGRRSPWTRSPSPRCRGRGSSPRSWAPRQRAAEQNTFWVLISFCFGISDLTFDDFTGLGHHVSAQLNTILRVTLDCKPTMEWHYILEIDIILPFQVFRVTYFR